MEAGGQSDYGKKQPCCAALLNRGYQRSDGPDKDQNDEREAKRAFRFKGGARDQGHDQRSQEQGDQAATHQDGQRSVVGRVDGRKTSGVDECPDAGAEERSAAQSVPACRPDIQALVEISPLKLLRNRCQALEDLAGNKEPERHGEGRKRKDAGENSLGVTAGQQQTTTGESNNRS